MDIKANHVMVMAEKAKLDTDNKSGFLFITSDDNIDKNSKAGVTAEVDTLTAAKHIVNRTAHPSSADEVASFKSAGQKFSANMAQQELKKNPMAPLIEALANSKPPVAPVDDKRK